MKIAKIYLHCSLSAGFLVYLFNDYVNIKTQYTDIYISTYLSEYVNIVL